MHKFPLSQPPSCCTYFDPLFVTARESESSFRPERPAVVFAQPGEQPFVGLGDQIEFNRPCIVAQTQEEVVARPVILSDQPEPFVPEPISQEEW